MGYIHRSVPDIVDDMALHKDYTDDVTVKECWL
jgi:hypothetical protein